MKNVIITGANSGLGFECAKKIAKASNDYRIIMACRNLQKAEQAKKTIMEYSGNLNIDCMELDTAEMESVRNFAADYVKKEYGPIYSLLCNAGISGKHTGITNDGFDVVFQTNHLGHFLLTKLLLPHIDENGKIFVVSSDMHDAPNTTMVWEGAEKLAHPYDSLKEDTIRYSYSKLCNLYFVYELTRRLEECGSNILVNAFNPGLMKTGFMTLDNKSIEFVKQNMPQRFGDLEKSSSALSDLVTIESLVTKSGLYYDRSTDYCSSSDLSYNAENAKELWAASETYVSK